MPKSPRRYEMRSDADKWVSGEALDANSREFYAFFAPDTFTVRLV